jgi:DNA-directed RNA polymerase specialized sigma24 family protein
MSKKGIRMHNTGGQDSSYAAWMGRHDMFTELPEANPDALAVEPHEPSAREEVVRWLLDRPAECATFFSPREYGVFFSHGVDSQTMRKTAVILGCTRREVEQALKQIQKKIAGLAARVEGGLVVLR